MNIKVDFDNIVVKEDKNDFNVKVLMLKGEKGDKGDGEQNVIDKIQVNGSDLPVTNKTVNVPVPTIDTTLSSSSTNPVENRVIYNALSNKVDNSDLNNYYEISEVDGLLNNKADNSIVDKKTYYFDNVADMKAYDLQNGDYAITKGYYVANDGGNAEYYITNTQIATEHQEELDNNLYATLIIKDYVTPEMFGAKGDGITDDANAFTKCFKSGLPIKCSNKVYGVTHVDLNNNNIYLDGNGCIFINLKLDMSEYADGTYTYKGISSMFSDDIPEVNEELVTYDNVTLKNFTINQQSDDVIGLNNEMHWGGLFTPILLVGCDNILVENVSVINTLQTGLYFYNAKNIKAINCNFENIGNNENLNTGSRNCFEMPSWSNIETNCIFEATNITAKDICDEFVRCDYCEAVQITNSNFKNIGGTIIETHSVSGSIYPSEKRILLTNVVNDGSKGLIHCNEQNSNVKLYSYINNVVNINSTGETNLYGVVYLRGNILCNISNSYLNTNGNGYTQGYINIGAGANININNSIIDMPLQIPVIRNYDTPQLISINNCKVTSNNLIRFEQGGYLNINNSSINSLYFITGTATEIKIYDSELNPTAQYGIQPTMSNGVFELINTTINSTYSDASSFISLSGTLKTLRVINNIINSTNITRLRLLAPTDKLEFIGNYVNADSQAFTGTRALQSNCLSIFTNNICTGTTFTISGTPTIQANNHNFTFS